MTLEADVKKAYTFAVDPGHLILAGLLFAAIIAGVYLFDSKRADLADSRAAVAEAKAALTTKQNSDFQAQVATQLAQLAAQNTQLSQTIATRKTQIPVVQKQDAQLPPDKLASKWATQVAVPNGVVSSANGYTVSPSAALSTVQALDELPLDRANITDLSTQLSNSSIQLSASTAAHLSDNNVCKVQLAAKDTEIAAVKADARRSKLRWFGAGFIAGILLRGAKF